jgi:predicted glutamine amidotransferase
MCQLLGMNCNAPTDVTFSFRGFAQRGGHTDHHTDGWGIAFFEGDGSPASVDSDKGLRHFVDHQPAWESPVAELIRRYPIKSRNVIAHIRKATQGRVALENCHPFVRELWGRYACTAASGPWAAPTANAPFAGSCRSWPNLTRACPACRN